MGNDSVDRGNTTEYLTTRNLTAVTNKDKIGAGGNSVGVQSNGELIETQQKAIYAGVTKVTMTTEAAP